MPKLTKIQIDLLKKFVEKFDLEIKNGEESITFENAVMILGGEIPKKKDREARRKEFADTLRPHLIEYGSDMLNRFYRYWAKDEGVKLKFETQTSWDLRRDWRLGRETTQSTKERNTYNNLIIECDMTPREKAYKMCDDLCWTMGYGNLEKEVKDVALFSVDEIIKSEPRCPSDVDWDDVGGTHQYYYEAQREDADKYWQEVKREIEKL